MKTNLIIILALTIVITILVATEVSAIDNITLTTDSGWNTQPELANQCIGLNSTANMDFWITSVTKPTSTTATQSRIWHGNNTLMGTANFSGNDATFSPAIHITSGQVIYITMSSTIAFTSSYKTYTHPASNTTYFSTVARLLSAAGGCSNEGQQTGYISDIISINVSATDPSPPATPLVYCYQETANVSTSCGGLNSGDYSSNFGLTAANVWDGDWGTAGASSSGNQTTYINYSKPIGSISSSLWQVKDSATANVSIAGCWNGFIDKIWLKVISGATTSDTWWFCYNGSAWTLLRVDTSDKNVYEEAMFWNMTHSGNMSYTSALMEYQQQNISLILNMSGNPAINITANLSYNGTLYSVAGINSSYFCNFTKSFTTPIVVSEFNESRFIFWVYELDYGGGTKIIYNTSNYTQTVYKARVNNTNAPGNGVASRFFQCKDEISNALVSCNISTVWKVWAPENYANAYYRAYTLTNNSANFHQFWHYPPVTISNLTTDYNISVIGTAGTYPQRNFMFTNESLNLTNQTKTLYLLSSTDGIYVTFQILTASSYTPINGASVTVTRTIGGETVGHAVTGPTGTVTFWMNPNTIHTVTVIHPSYNSVSVADTFTGNFYTIFMGEELPWQNQTTNYTGMSWQILPNPTDLLCENTAYNFSFNLTSTRFNLTNYGFNLFGDNNVFYASNSSNESSGGYVSINNFNISNNATIRMNYYWVINGSGTMMNQTYIVQCTYQGNYSIKTFFDDLTLYSNSGNFLTPFTLTLIAFFIIFFIVGTLSYVSGIYSPLAIGGTITVLTWFFAAVGMIRSPNPNFEWVVIPIIITLLYVAYIIWENVR